MLVCACAVLLGVKVTGMLVLIDSLVGVIVVVKLPPSKEKGMVAVKVTGSA